MKDQIYKILESKVKLLTYASREAYTKEAAEEISEHVFEFIEWLHDNTDDTRVQDDKLWWCIPCEYYDTIENIYNYWLKTLHAGVRMIPVASSQIRSIGYASNTLYIEFLKGGVYSYSDVPENMFEDFVRFDSKGKFFAGAIKGKFDFEKTEKIVTNGKLK